MFTTSDAGLLLIETAESLKLSPYLDTGRIWTAGWGHALTTPAGQVIDEDVFGATRARALMSDAMQRQFGGQVLNRAQADAQLHKDLVVAEAAVNRICDTHSYQCEFDAMVSFAFNAGVGAFRGSSIARLYAAGSRKVGDVSLKGMADWSKTGASPTDMAQAYAAWSNSGGHWTLGLYHRRIAEALVFGGHDAAESIRLAWAFKG